MSVSNYNVKQGSESYDIFDWYTIYGATVSVTANVITSPINNRLCIKVIGSTTILIPLNKIINFVAVGGGQSGASNGGRGGGTIYGTLGTSDLLTITIGAGGADTTITGTNISITAYAGPNSGLVSGTSVYSSTINLGGAGGTTFPNVGSDGPFISNLGIYGGGGGGGPDTSGGGAVGPPGGSAGGGSGGNIEGVSGVAGAPNTGGGGGANAGFGGGAGGSGVVYLYI